MFSRFGGVARQSFARLATKSTGTESKRRGFTFAACAAGAGLAVAAGTGLALASNPSSSSSSSSVSSSSCGGDEDAANVSVVLFQYEVCPFSCKVKAFLDANDVPYRKVEVNPLTKEEIRWSEYRKIPLATIDGEPANGSNVIIERVRDISKPGDLKFGAAAPEGKELEWFDWVDDKLVRTLPPNIYRTPGESLQAFEYITENGNWSTLSRYAALYFGAAAMYVISKRLKKKYAIKDERESLYGYVGDWLEAVGKSDFHGGSAPNSADIAVFGVLRSIEGLDTFEDMMKNTQIEPWYARMKSTVGKPSHVNIVVEPAPDFRAEIRQIK